MGLSPNLPPWETSRKDKYFDEEIHKSTCPLRHKELIFIFPGLSFSQRRGIQSPPPTPSSTPTHPTTHVPLFLFLSNMHTLYMLSLPTPYTGTQGPARDGKYLQF